MATKMMFFWIVFLSVVFQGLFLGQERYPQGEEVTPESRYYIVYVVSEVDEVIGYLSNYIRECEKQEKVNIYGTIYPMRIKKEERRSDEYEWRHTDILRFRAIYNFNYHYKVNNGWMYYQIFGEVYRNLFSAIFKRNEKKKEKIELVFRLYYFPWKKDVEYDGVKWLKEMEDKWRSFSKFVDGFVEYMKKEGIEIIKVEKKP